MSEDITPTCRLCASGDVAPDRKPRVTVMVAQADLWLCPVCDAPPESVGAAT